MAWTYQEKGQEKSIKLIDMGQGGVYCKWKVQEWRVQGPGQQGPLALHWIQGEVRIVWSGCRQWFRWAWERWAHFSLSEWAGERHNNCRVWQWTSLTKCYNNPNHKHEGEGVNSPMFIHKARSEGSPHHVSTLTWETLLRGTENRLRWWWRAKPYHTYINVFVSLCST